jgi:hypothetical protein
LNLCFRLEQRLVGTFGRYTIVQPFVPFILNIENKYIQEDGTPSQNRRITERKHHLIKGGFFSPGGKETPVHSELSKVVEMEQECEEPQWAWIIALTGPKPSPKRTKQMQCEFR